MKRLLLLFLFLLPARAEEWKKTWEVSVGALVAANVADAATSWGLRESNPLLGSRFDGKSVAIKGGLVGGSLVLQALLIKRHPRIAKKLAIINFGVSAGLAGVAWHNTTLR